MHRNMLLLTLVVFIGFNSLVYCDTPASCVFDDIQGDWIFHETERSEISSINCTTMGPLIHKRQLKLVYPNIVEDDEGNKGTWTMMYNEGFEVRILGRSYFAFSYYTIDSNGNVTSICGKTWPGWSHDVTIRNWSCYIGKKVQTVKHRHHILANSRLGHYKINKDFIRSINSKQNSWRAKAYAEYEFMTMKDIHRRVGALNSPQPNVKPARASILSMLRSTFLPENWDWRNISGINYVSPVRNQWTCGSCYAFASMASLEARVRIQTRNNEKPIFSPQDVVECSVLSQGCEGGFGFTIAGRYTQDYGVVLEECNPYKGVDGKCSTNPSCLRHYVSAYRYVGGYYGGGNEADMKIALIKGGPLVVAMEVHSDFLLYSKGIYKHTGIEDRYNPLELTNHAVTLVGYGKDEETDTSYWIIKNSWGTGWGEDGYFRIVRGIDNCGVESCVTEVVPIPA